MSKVILLKDDKLGSEPLGSTLLARFLATTAALENRPSTIICVNNAVKITTSRAHPSYEPLSNLEKLGVRVLSCGTCLNALGVTDQLSIGEASNANEIMSLLLSHETLSL